MHDMNILPYGADDERNAIMDAAADAERVGDADRFLRYMAELENLGMVYGDTPAKRATGVDDWSASGLPLPPALRAAPGWRPTGIVNKPDTNVRMVRFDG